MKGCAYLRPEMETWLETDCTEVTEAAEGDVARSVEYPVDRGEAVLSALVKDSSSCRSSLGVNLRLLTPVRKPWIRSSTRPWTPPRTTRLSLLYWTSSCWFEYSYLRIKASSLISLGVLLEFSLVSVEELVKIKPSLPELKMSFKKFLVSIGMFLHITTLCLTF